MKREECYPINILFVAKKPLLMISFIARSFQDDFYDYAINRLQLERRQSVLKVTPSYYYYYYFLLGQTGN